MPQNLSQSDKNLEGKADNCNSVENNANNGCQLNQNGKCFLRIYLSREKDKRCFYDGNIEECPERRTFEYLINGKI